MLTYSICIFGLAKYETVRNRSLFRRASMFLRDCKKSSSGFAKKKKIQINVSFCNFAYILWTYVTLSSIFVPFIRVSYLLFKLFTFFRVSSLFRQNYRDQTKNCFRKPKVVLNKEISYLYSKPKSYVWNTFLHKMY